MKRFATALAVLALAVTATLVVTTPTPARADFVTRIKNVSSGRVLALSTENPQNGTTIITTKLTDSWTQFWTGSETSKDITTYSIKGWFLDTHNIDKTSILAWPANGDQNQMWWLDGSPGDNTFYMHNYKFDHCLTDMGDGNPVKLKGCDNPRTQIWTWDTEPAPKKDAPEPGGGDNGGAQPGGPGAPAPGGPGAPAGGDPAKPEDKPADQKDDESAAPSIDAQPASDNKGFALDGKMLAVSGGALAGLLLLTGLAVLLVRWRFWRWPLALGGLFGKARDKGRERQDQKDARRAALDVLNDGAPLATARLALGTLPADVGDLVGAVEITGETAVLHLVGAPEPIAPWTAREAVTWETPLGDLPTAEATGERLPLLGATASGRVWINPAAMPAPVALDGDQAVAARLADRMGSWLVPAGELPEDAEPTWRWRLAADGSLDTGVFDLTVPVTVADRGFREERA